MAPIESGQRGLWRSVVAKVAIVIIFYDEAIGCLGPLEQRDAALQRERRTRWKLMSVSVNCGQM